MTLPDIHLCVNSFFCVSHTKVSNPTCIYLLLSKDLPSSPMGFGLLMDCSQPVAPIVTSICPSFSASASEAITRTDRLPSSATGTGSSSVEQPGSSFSAQILTAFLD
jgi:hypothetical protein